MLGLHAEFYKMAGDDHVAAKMVVTGLEKQIDLLDADNMVELMYKLDWHMMTQLMKAVANFRTRNTKNKSGGGKGSAASGH